MSIFNKIKNKVKKNSTEEIQENQDAQEGKVTEKKSSKSKKPSLKEQLAESEEELANLKDKYLRIFAEFDNYKKRTIKEKMEFMRTASQDVLADILPVLDDFDRAKQVSDDENSDESFPEGVTLVYSKLHGIMKNKGILAMESTGAEFDSELHEAITKIPAPTPELKGKIVDTIQKGYYLNDKIIRHAKVVVGE